MIGGGRWDEKKMAGAAVPSYIGTYHRGLTVVRHSSELLSTMEDKFVLGERSVGGEGVKVSG